MAILEDLLQAIRENTGMLAEVVNELRKEDEPQGSDSVAVGQLRPDQVVMPLANTAGGYVGGGPDTLAGIDFDLDDSDSGTAVVGTVVDQPTKRRGRPPGSKNVPKAPVATVAAPTAPQAVATVAVESDIDLGDDLAALFEDL